MPLLPCLLLSLAAFLFPCFPWFLCACVCCSACACVALLPNSSSSADAVIAALLPPHELPVCDFRLLLTAVCSAPLACCCCSLAVLLCWSRCLPMPCLLLLLVSLVSALCSDVLFLLLPLCWLPFRFICLLCFRNLLLPVLPSPLLLLCCLMQSPASPCPPLCCCDSSLVPFPFHYCSLLVMLLCHCADDAVLPLWLPTAALDPDLIDSTCLPSPVLLWSLCDWLCVCYIVLCHSFTPCAAMKICCPCPLPCCSCQSLSVVMLAAYELVLLGLILWSFMLLPCLLSC